MGLLRVVRKLDDLAEVLIFDVALATPRRRRLCSAAAGITLLAAYVSSGFWMAPESLPEPLPTFTAPAGAAHLLPAMPSEQTELAAEIVRVGKINPDRHERLLTALELHRFELDRFVSLAGRDAELFMLCQAVGLARVSSVATMLLARGVVYADDEPSSAVRDWITTARIAAALTLPATDSNMPMHATASVLLSTAVNQLEKVVRTNDLTAGELEAISSAVTNRPSLTAALGAQFQEESGRMHRILTRWAETNELPPTYRGLRFYLPVRAASRRAVALRIAGAFDAHLSDLAGRMFAGEPLPPRAPFTECRIGGWNFRLTEGATWTDRLGTLWSNERAADVASTLLVSWRPRTTESYATACQRHEREAASLAALCATKL